MYQKVPGSWSIVNYVPVIIFQSSCLIQSVAAKGGASRGVSASGGGSGGKLASSFLFLVQSINLL